MVPLWTLWLTASLGLLGPDRAAPEKVALVVGIDHYEHPGADRTWRNLHGSVNDAHRVRDLLVARFGFEPADVLVLTDAEATHERIVRAFHEHLILRAGADTEAVFWFSGHGSRIPDGSGREGVEPDGLDATLVAYDSRREGARGSFDLTDDELHSLLRALCARTSRVTVVTDACHSGGVTRGPGAVPARAAPPGGRPVRFEDLSAFWPPDVPFLEDGDPRRAVRLPYVHIAACATHQSAAELPVLEPDGSERRFGALTWYLTDALERVERGTTYERLVRDVAVRLADRFPNQDVQWCGPAERCVFDSRFAPPLPGFDAVLPPGGDTFEVEAGSLHLLRRGSMLEVRDLAGERLGRARVTRIGSERSAAAWLDPVPRIAARLPVRVVEVERPPGDEPLVVHLPEGAIEDRVAAALGRLRGVPVRLLREQDSGAAYQLFRPEGDDGPFALWTAPEGLPLWREAPSAHPDRGEEGEARAGDIARRLAPVLRREIRFRALLALAEQQGNVPIHMEIRRPEQSVLEKLRDVRAVPLVPVEMRPLASRGLDDVFSSGTLLVDRGGEHVLDVAQIRLGLDDEAACGPVHVAVLCVSEDRSVSVVYPQSGDRDNVLAPGETKGDIYVSVFASRAWRAPRPQRDRYLAVATERYVDYSSLERVGAFLPSDPARGSAEPLPPILEQALAGQTTRGRPIRLVHAPAFGIAAVDVFVARAPP